jgi:ABC-type glycerol-3-phosphate transport system substrate-binding protein
VIDFAPSIERWMMAVSTSNMAVDLGGRSTAAPLSRRALLRMLGSSVLGAGVLSSCAKKGAAGGDVVLRLAEAPYGVMPAAKKREQSLTSRAYGEALQDWLRKNPGVTLKPVNVDIWTQDVIVTAVNGGTAPAIYSSNALGSWSQPAILAAFRQGLAADVTKLLDRSGLIDKLADYARPVWEGMWPIHGKYYGAPSGFGVSDGMFYRRDLFEQAGLAEPKPQWTWWDVRRMAKALTAGKRKGWASPKWGLGVALDSDALDLLSTIPAPDTPWHWTYNYAATQGLLQTWVSVVENWRGMMFEDRSIISDVSYDGWDEVMAAFRRQDIAIQPGNVDEYVEPSDSPTSLLRLAKQVDKPIWDVVGWMTYPLGKLGEFPARRSYVDAYSLSPDLNDEELNKTFDLYAYMTGSGFIKQKKVVYEETKNLQMVYGGGTIVPLLSDTRAKLPGSPEEAWGKRYVAEVERAARRPIAPESSSYLPPEEKTLPSEPVDDAMSKWMYEPGRPDIKGGFDKLAGIRNKQAQSLRSDVSKQDFVKGAKKYLEAQAAFHKADAPEFYTQVFQPWYVDIALPALEQA